MNNNNYGPMALKKSVLTQNKNLTLFHENKDSMYFVNNKELLILNNETFEGKKYTISGELKHLGSNFYFSSYHYNNAFLKGDTLYASLFFSSLNRTTSFFTNFKEYLKEPSMFRFKMEKDSLKVLDGVINRPEIALLQTPNFNTYSIATKNNLYVIFGGIDTLYSYDFISNQEEKIALHNPFYRENDEYDWDNLDFSYDSKFNIENFTYRAIYLSVDSNNLILFFNAPYWEEEKIPYDNHLYAMVLNEDFKIKKFYNLGRNYDANCIIGIPEKGLAIPYTNIENEKVVYHIYRF